jgi:hypothetical protein
MAPRVTDTGRNARWAASIFTIAAAASFSSTPAEAQEQLGNKQLGTLGLHAGSVAEPGIALLGRFFGYTADKLTDRNGNDVPIGLALATRGAVFGAAATLEVRPIATYLSVSGGMPIVRVTTNTQRSEASTDIFGLGDLFLQPLKLGWKLGRVELVTGYAVYVPTGQFEPGGSGSIGHGNITHEPSLGGTVFLDSDKKWYLSALASVDVSGRKRDVDITRGTTLQVQGGAGTTLFHFVDAGVAGYVLSQITDDSGSDLPAPLRGARDRAFGVGPEIDVNIVAIRGRLTFRYEHDFAVQSRPEGQIFILEFGSRVWAPGAPTASR